MNKAISGDRRDVIVIGGGPAGSASATLLAMAGHDVLLLEKETFPRPHIGESLMPATYWTFQRLGVLDKLHAGGFVSKESVRFFTPSGKAAVPFYFDEVESGDSARTWQVDRAAFDQVLLEHAAQQGVDVHTGVSVGDVLMDGDAVVGVAVSGQGTGRQEIRARVVVDASGQNSILSRRLNLRVVDPILRHVAYFTRFDGGRREEGRDAGATLILHTRNSDSWFWYIPLPGGVTSVGVVGAVDYLIKGRGRDAQAIFDEERLLCPALEPWLEAATQSEPVRVERDFSYVSRRIAGDGWVLAGDAFGFLDPIYSSGVFLALKGAEFAADAVHAALEAGDTSASRLGQHGPQFIAGMEALRRLVYAYYDRDFSFAAFVREHPEIREDLVNMLVGNVYRRDCGRLLELLNSKAPVAGYSPLSLADHLS